MFDGIVRRLEDAVAFAKGDVGRARATAIQVTDLDVKAIREKTGLAQNKSAGRRDRLAFCCG
ncbi:MAG: hypothetical protein ACRDFQ_07905 [Anaerolineales bacterium]